MKVQSHFGDMFHELTDHRVNRTKLHSLENIIFISMSAIISGAQTWNEIEEFGKGRIDWLSKYLDLPYGIPSHDTFNRFFSNLDTEKFEGCFRQWVNSFKSDFTDDVISIDGKNIRGSRRTGVEAVHMISAWSKNAGITIGQLAVDNKGKEIQGMTDLLDALFIEGAVVTIDANGTRSAIAKKIIEKNANYILQVKMNNKNLMLDIKCSFDSFKPDSEYTSKDWGHSRIETRKISVVRDLSKIKRLNEWTNLNSIVLVESETLSMTTGEATKSTAYYLTSLTTDAEHIGKAIRSHWGIENNLHWMLDVAFSEDHSVKRNKNAVINYSLMSKIALDFLKKETTMKAGVKLKRMKAGWSMSYLEKVMGLNS